MKKSLLCSLMLMALPAVGFAQTTSSTNFNATTTVASSCTIATTQNILFGTFDPVGLHASVGPSSQGQVSVNCTKGGYGVTINNGLNGSGYVHRQVSVYPAGWFEFTYACGRRMAGPSSSFIRYDLFSDAAMTNAGVNTSTGTGTSPSTPSCTAMNTNAFSYVTFNSAGAQLVNIYARIPVNAASAQARPGTYVDTLSVSVNF